ncbi:MAG TPA: hypothetical protein PK072_09975, partial [Quisquiliibacterium sp.]|nr:hypothetical protein [Quisquiliibacterium sp.]
MRDISTRTGGVSSVRGAAFGVVDVAGVVDVPDVAVVPVVADVPDAGDVGDCGAGTGGGADMEAGARRRGRTEHPRSGADGSR